MTKLRDLWTSTLGRFLLRQRTPVVLPERPTRRMRPDPEPVPDLSAGKSAEELVAERDAVLLRLEGLNWELLAGAWPSPRADVLTEWRRLWMIESHLALYPGGQEAFLAACRSKGVEGRREARPALAAMAGDAG